MPTPTQTECNPLRPSRLCGTKLVRLAFLDESGRSRREPFLVVAGMIIHGDHDYRPLEERLKAIVEKHIPEPDRDGFVFHAKEIFHGGKYFDRTTWPRERRLPLLDELASIPQKINFPVVFGHISKAEYRASIADTIATMVPKTRDHAIDVAEHMQAFARCEIAIERHMYTFPRDEIAMLIAEDTDRVKDAVKAAHTILKSQKELAEGHFAEVEGLPLKKIVDTPHFAAKADSAPLQIADVCAFLIMRRLMRREDTQPYFEKVATQLTWRAADFGEPMGTERTLRRQRP